MQASRLACQNIKYLCNSMSKILKYSLIGGFLILVFACEVDSNCGSINVDYVIFDLVDLDAQGLEVEKSVLFDSITSPDAIITIFEQRDTVDVKLSSFLLPLNPVGDTTEYYFYYEGQTDTIRFSHEKINRVDSPECGIDMEFIGLDTVFQTFDSLIIVNDTLRRRQDNAPNIKLFID